jgi:CHAT domain-containing protein
MPQFFSMDEFMQHVEQALELEDAYEETHDESLLEVEIELWQRIIPDPLFKHMPQDFQAIAYGQAGQSFFYRYHLDTTRMGDLEKAGQLFRNALLHVSDAALRATLLHSLADVQTNFYQQRGKLADLEQSIAHYRAAIAHIEPDDIDVPVYLGFRDDLGTALRDHYIHTWNLSSLDESIKTHQETLKIAARFSSNPARYSNHLGNALFDRYKHLEEIEDLQQAIEAFQRALTSSPEGDPARPGYLSNLGNAFSHRSKHLNDITDLERAIRLQREAVSLTPRDAYSRTNLGIDLGSYYTWAGRQEAIDESIAIFEKIIEDEGTSPPSPDLPDYHANLAISLLHRYDGRADREDLRRALHHYTLALELAAGSSTQEEQQPLLLDASARPSYLYGLAGALLSSYLAIGRVADLKEAIERLHEALQLLPTTAVSMQAEYRRGLSNLLIHLYDREHQLEQLDEAITFAEYGIQHLDARSPQLARMYNALGTALRHRYLAAHNLADIQNAIAAFHKALAESPAESPELTAIHTNLGNALRNSYTDFHDVQTLEEAITHYRSATDLNKGEIATNNVVDHSDLGTMLFERYDVLHRPEDLEEARRECAEACRLGVKLTSEIARGTARPWGNREAHMGNWSWAAQAYDYAVQAQESLYQVQLLQTEREGLLEEESEIYARAAYVMARAGKLQEAVTTLEQGRAKRLGEALERDQADLQHVQQQHPQAFQRYQEAASRLRQLEHFERSNWLLDPRHDKFQKQAAIASSYKQISRAREDLEQAIERIRQLPGLTDFLRKLTFQRIAQATLPAHPLAYLVTAQWGCLILFVRHSHQEAEALFVETFTEKDLQKLFFTIGEGMVLEGYMPALISGSRPALSQTLQTMHHRIGSSLIAPLAHHLHEIGATGVTLIPAGQFSVFPLHAVRYEKEGQETTLLDEFDVTYAPSARVLGIALREAQRRNAPFHLLAIGDPYPLTNPVQQEASSTVVVPPRLTHALIEVEQISKLLPSQASTSLCENKATLDAVWKELPQATIVHFACHGYFNPQEPLDSELWLANDTHLTLRTLLNAEQQHLARLRMAVLSACTSALTDFQHLPDEVVGLPAGFLQAGVPLVVGTLWSVNDQSTELLMRRFYELYLRGDPQKGLEPQPPARALRLAQLWLRDLTRDELAAYNGADPDPRQSHTASRHARPYADPYYWAAFVYYGAPLETNEAN